MEKAQRTLNLRKLKKNKRRRLLLINQTSPQARRLKFTKPDALEIGIINLRLNDLKKSNCGNRTFVTYYFNAL